MPAILNLDNNRVTDIVRDWMLEPTSPFSDHFTDSVEAAYRHVIANFNGRVLRCQKFPIFLASFARESFKASLSPETGIEADLLEYVIKGIDWDRLTDNYLEQIFVWATIDDGCDHYEREIDLIG